MKTYYDRQLQPILDNWIENIEKNHIQIKLSSIGNKDKSTNTLNLNLESIESFRAMLDIMEEELVTLQEKVLK